MPTQPNTDANPNRLNALRLALLAFAAGALILTAIALACAPAAPARQDGDNAAATATPEASATATATSAPTDTPTTKPSNTPTTEPTATSNPPSTPTSEPTATPQSTRTPSPTSTPFLTTYITKTMIRLTDKAAAAQAAGSTYDGPLLPNTIRVNVNLRPSHKDALVQYLHDNGATEIRVGEFLLMADIPPLLLGPVIRHPAFRSGGTSEGIYPWMVPELGNPLTRYAAGELTAAQAGDAINEARNAGTVEGSAAEREWVDAIIVLKSPDDNDAVRAFLKANGANPYPKSPYMFPIGKQILAAVRVPLFDRLYRHPGVARIKLEVLPLWPEPKDAPTPGPAGQAGPTPTPQGAAAHGARVWHAASYKYKRSGVKVGVIDVGFQKFNKSMESGQLPAAAKVNWRCKGKNGVVTEGYGTTPGPACLRQIINATYATHGAMASEAVYDVAPGAILYISNLPRDDAAAWMKGRGVQIVNASLAGWDGPGDGTGPSNDVITRTVATPSREEIRRGAAKDGVLFVNGAGNSNQKTWYGSGLSYAPISEGYRVAWIISNDDCIGIVRHIAAGSNIRFEMR